MNEHLDKHPIEATLEDFDKQIAVVKDKIVAGSEHLATLLANRKPIKEKIKFINEGLLPPAFKFDDSEELKNAIQIWLSSGNGFLMMWLKYELKYLRMTARYEGHNNRLKPLKVNQRLLIKNPYFMTGSLPR
jgi:hypothetical protein